MNDLDLLDTHGPAATPLHDDVLARARTALVDEIDRTGGTRDLRAVAVTPLAPGRPGRRRRIAVGLVAACVAAATAVVTPSLLHLDGSDAVALAAVDPLTFPLSPDRVPDGLGRPVFEMDSGVMRAQYGTARDGLTVTTGVDSVGFWDVPGDAATVAVAGRPGRLYSATARDGTTAGFATVAVLWQEEDGDWTRVGGSGSYADAASVESFAESLRAVPQQARLALTVAPEGWLVAAYKEDRVVRFTPGGDPSGDDLTVSLVGDPDPDLAGSYGATDVTTAQVHGRQAQVGRTGEGWVLVALTPQGQRYSVQAPQALTRQQVVEVADGVTYTP